MHISTYRRLVEAQARVDSAVADVIAISGAMSELLRCGEDKIVAYCAGGNTGSDDALPLAAKRVASMFLSAQRIGDVAARRVSDAKGATDDLFDAMAEEPRSDAYERLRTVCTDSVRKLGLLSDEIGLVDRSMSSCLLQLQQLIDSSALPKDGFAEFDLLIARLRARRT